MPVCANCGNQAGEGAVFCDQCGARLPTASTASDGPQATARAAATVICSACGAGNVPGEAYCDFCGSPLEQPLPAPEAEPVQLPAPVGEPTEVEAPAAVAVPTGDEVPTCPACGARVQPGEAFCADCGASLAQPPIAPELAPDEEPEPVEVAPGLAPLTEPEGEAEAVTEEEVAPEEAPVTVIVEAEAAALTCPACGIDIDAGDKFCRNCGAVMEAAPAGVETPSVTPSAGRRLIVLSSGAEIPLPSEGEILIGREDPISGVYPEVDLTPHDGEVAGVSRRHARLTVEGGKLFVEDLDSTNYTFVNRQRLVPKTRHPLNDGDELRCGRVALKYAE